MLATLEKAVRTAFIAKSRREYKTKKLKKREVVENFYVNGNTWTDIGLEELT